MGTILKNGINYSGTSGGSGVSSYNELTEKPKIEGVTLSGNKTASDLGLVKASDIPSTDSFYSTSDSAFTDLADADYMPMYDSSASTKKKTLWSNIKSVLKTYFDTIYSTTRTRGTATSGGTTLSLVNTGDMYTWNNKQNQLTAGNGIGLTSAGVISTTTTVALKYTTGEQEIGTWMGKKLYQCSFSLSVKDSTSEYSGSIFTLPSTADTIVSITGMVTNDDAISATHQLPYYGSTTSYCRLRVGSTRQNLNVALRNVISGTTYLWIIGTVQYTKP